MIGSSSFISANVFPWKILADSKITTSILTGKIYPAHIQINPTNACPFSCSFCSCKNREKNQSMDIEKAIGMLSIFRELGTKAVTITGGGDPLAYPHINRMLDAIFDMGMKIGLVTNGFYFHKLTDDAISKLTWCRISVSDEIDRIPEVPLHIQTVDWAFSYVLPSKLNKKMIRKVVDYANMHNFTHIRVVEDLINNSISVQETKTYLESINIDISRIIFQGRKQYTAGQTECYTSLMKPNIDAEFNMFPCCGVQYATKENTLNFDPKLSMANLSDPSILYDIYENQKIFDGSVCIKCFYNEYNECLHKLKNANKMVHKEFI